MFRSLFFTLVLVMAGAQAARGQVTAADSLALVGLYNGTTGANWTNKANWLTGPVGTWFGVTRTGNRVTQISLPSNNLVTNGANPLPNLSALNALTRLNLSGNIIGGVIPATLNSLTNLQHLDLSGNRFTGAITSLPSLTSLTYLSLSNNVFLSLQAVPTFIYNLTSLRYLYLSDCRRNSLPRGINHLSSLEEFDISVNPISLSDLELGDIAGIFTLRKLNISSIFTVSIVPPTSLASLPQLSELNISNNAFMNLPPLSAWASSNVIVDISLNQLDFGDLEPFAGVSNPVFINTGQRPFPLLELSGTTIKLLEGDPFLLHPTVGGSQNAYQWFFNSNPIPGATNLVYDGGTIGPGNVGVYSLRITNSLVRGITLNSANVTFTVEPSVETRFKKVNNIILNDTQASSYGGSWADMDADGDEDLFVNQFFSNYPKPNFLYENLGNGDFKKIVTGEIVSRPDGPRFSPWGDYDNDGYPDMYVGNYWPTTEVSSFYKNNGNKTFSRTEFPHRSDGGNWVDYDNDGDLDLSINRTSQNPVSAMLYKNNGNGTFTLIDNFVPETTSWFAGWIDIDNDGDMDYNMTPSPASTQIKIYRNNGSGSFSEENLPMPASGFSHRGSSWGDIDGDGDIDLLAVNQSGGGSAAHGQFYLNDGTGHFTMIAASTRLGGVQAWGSRASVMGDADNDGDLDLFIGNTIATDLRNQLFLNDGHGMFTAVPLNEQHFGYTDGLNGLSLADYDNDGSLDLFIGSFDGLRPNYLFRNLQSNNGNHWLKLRLVGVQSNKSAIGARIEFFSGLKLFSRQIVPSSGFASQSSYIVHSGLGSALQADSVYIYWPSGLVQKLRNVAADQLLTVVEGNVPILPPTVQASNMTFSNILSRSMDVAITPGNGAKRLVVMKAGAPPSFTPSYNKQYVGDLGNGDSVVYNGAGSSFALSKLEPSTTYHFKVFEFNTDNLQTQYLVTGALSGNATTTPLPDVYVMSPVHEAIDQDTTLNVTARAVTGATVYTIELSTDSIFTTPVIRSGARTQLFDDLSHDTIYYTRVKTDLRPDYGMTTSFRTKVWEVITGDVVAADTNMRLLVFPNPVGDQLSFRIESASDQSAEITLVDMTGRIMQRLEAATNQTVEIRTPYAKGIYLLQARSISATRTVRLVKE